MILRDQILSLPFGRTPTWPHRRDDYERGHRDARHAAAELALKADEEIARLHSNLECENRLRKDAEENAERYRWLRDVSAGCTNQAAPFVCGSCDLPIHGVDVDAAIDAAMKSVGAA